MLNNYTKANARKLSKWKIGNLTEPFPIEIYWLNSMSIHNKSDHVNSKIHQHSFYEAHFNIDGTSSYTDAEGLIYDLSQKGGILFTPQTKHCIREMSPNTIRFSLTFGLEPGSALNSSLSQQAIYHFPLSPRLIDCIDTILYEIRQESAFSPMLIRDRTFEILCEIFRAIEVDEAPVKYREEDPENTALLKATQYISDNGEKLLTCSEVAEYCHYNVKYLSRIFAKQTGHTLLEYIHDQKIKYAEALLADDSLSLKQISEKLGFANEYYFNSFFKRKNGITPGKFRKMKKQ